MASAKKLMAYLDGLKGCFVAGGAITSIYTNKEIMDFDIYPKSDEALRDAIYWAYEQNGYWCVDHSSRAMTFAKGEKGENPNIQIMHFDTFETADKIFDAFDFTICMGAYDLDEEKFVLHENFLEHCSQRFLSFNRNTRYPYASARRVKKYEDRGYTIGMIEFQKIILACTANPITSWDQLREQIGGVYGEAITIPDGEEFSTDAMWKALDTLTFKGPSGGFDSAEEAVLAISRAPVRCFERGGTTYADVNACGSFQPIKCKPRNPVVVTVTEAFNGLTFYKAVNVTPDGTILAPHRMRYEYKIGELNVSPSGPGIYCYDTQEGAWNHNFSAAKPNKKMVLEVKADSEDDVSFDTGVLPIITLKKCMPVKLYEERPAKMPPDDLDERPF